MLRPARSKWVRSALPQVGEGGGGLTLRSVESYYKFSWVGTISPGGFGLATSQTWTGLDVTLDWNAPGKLTVALTVQVQVARTQRAAPEPFRAKRHDIKLATRRLQPKMHLWNVAVDDGMWKRTTACENGQRLCSAHRSSVGRCWDRLTHGCPSRAPPS